MSRTLKLLAVGLLLAGGIGLAIVSALLDRGESAPMRAATAPVNAAPLPSALADGGAPNTDTNPPFAATGGDGATTLPYSVTLSPVGEVTFAAVPQRVVTLDANYNDMLAALGRAPSLLATGSQENFFGGYYSQLPGPPIGRFRDDLQQLFGEGGNGIDKERFYQLRADVHLIDPTRLSASRSWTDADVAEIAANVGPFFGNRYSRENSYPGEAPYTYYSIGQLSEKVGDVFRDGARMARLQALTDTLIASIQAKLPPPETRPRVGLVIYNGTSFLPFSIVGEGYGQAQYRDVGARDAFETISASTYADAGRGARLDLEGLLTLNPDVLIVPWAIYPRAHLGYEEMLKLRADPLAGRIAAFRENRVYPGGSPLQGPLFYLFQIEMAAKQIYPDRFGPYRDDQAYPPAEQLFDRAAVAAILASTPAP